MKKPSRLLIAEGMLPSREAAERIRAGDYVRDTSQKGLRARRMFRVVRLGVGQALLVPATQEGDAGAVRALLGNLEKVRPTYGDLLGHTYSVLANGVAWRMEAKGETFEEATRHMTSWRRGNVSPQTEALIREMVETGKAPEDVR